jgi:protein-glutamine gamma-glutamyltransferase
MSFERALELTSILLASASFIGLALSAQLPAWLAILTGCALVLVLLRTMGIEAVDRLATMFRLSTSTWNFLLVLGFLAFLIDVIWISDELLPAGIRFLLLLMVIKLCNLQLRRDFLHLYAISLMALLASAALTTDLWYLPIFLAYLITGVWTLLLFQLTKKSDDDTTGLRPATPAQHHGRVTPQLFWAANGLALGTFACTLILFFAIPRVSAGLFQKGYGESIRTSGFSDRVDLGSIGPIKRDPTVVMRVELPDQTGGKPDALYLRGVAYDYYDGKSWANQLTHRRVLNETAPRTFAIRAKHLRPGEPPSPVFRQNILLESLDTAVLFGAPFAEAVTGPFPSVLADSLGALYLPFPSSTRIEYSVVSRPNPLLEADRHLHTVVYPESFGRHFLQTPAQSEKVAQLARDLTQSIESPYQKAVAIEKFLSEHFHYSLDVSLTNQEHPLEDFLFVTKTGYCEHYATSMVILLRSIGIPARLVTGFLATEWNEYGNYFLVRQQDAHAWVELHLPRSGWVMVDPTPAVAEASAAPGWHALGRIVDNLRLRWNRLFVQYSAADQIAVVRDVTTGSASAWSSAWESTRQAFSRLVVSAAEFVDHIHFGPLQSFIELLGLALLGLGVIVLLAWKRPWALFQLTTVAHKEQAIIAVYKTMLRHLADKGFSKPTTTPPIQFLDMVRGEWEKAGTAVAMITELYCRARFGHHLVTDIEISLAHQHLHELMTLDRHQA